MKQLICVLLTIAILVALNACSVSFPARRPTEGVWYCEELKISVDFSLLEEKNKPECAKLHNDDGTVTDILCYIDYGDGIGFESVDHKTFYIAGDFCYRRGVFTVKSHSDDKIYTFIRIDEEQ